MTVQPLLTGAQIAGPRIERILASPGPTRAQVIGPAGSGKTAALEFVREGLVARGLEVHTLQDGVDIAAIPAEAVLIVDDLHLLSDERTESIMGRAHTPGAGLVVALRPGPLGDSVRTIERLLQRSSPPIVLGEVCAAEVNAHLRAQGRPAPGPCIDDVLDLTGGAAWLVTFALSSVHAEECRGGADHHALRRDLHNQVLQRLATLDVPLRRFIEQLSLGTDLSRPPQAYEGALDELVLLGYAEGLLLRNGRLVPAVRAAVRSSLTHRWGDANGATLAEEITRGCLEEDGSVELLLDGVRDPRVGDAIAARADQIADHRPDHASRLYGAALRAGANPSDLAQRRARAAWAVGDLAQAGLLVDEAIEHSGSRADAELVDIAASVLAARDMMGMAANVYGTRTYEGATAVRAEVARIGSGHPEPGRDPAELPADQGVSSQLDVALYLLDRGLRSSLSQAPSPTALSDLVRASELYTASGTASPIPELPAVIAASVAMGMGDLATACQVLDDAVSGGQGQQWARRRLLLWQGLAAIQAERPDAARRAYTLAQQEPTPLGARDARLGHILQVTLARRFGDLAALQASWAGIRGAVAHPDVDLYTIFPLATLMGAAARLGDSTTLAAHVQLGLDLLHRLGSPPLWSTHLWWAGIQQGILLNTPDALAPFAKALVGAADRSPLAATMAGAGSVWVQVLAGKVDADAVEDAARSLGSAGLAWDGGRLAAHGARRTTDRRVAARLLSCARDLHPKESTSGAATPDGPARVAPTGADSELSEREREVARLILKGKTYVEIGEAIFISPRTVEHHVAHMRRRLEAGSRSDLIAKLRLALDSTQDTVLESPNRGVRV
ncbi:MAG: helix-turn-helix transcriptional regulator [Dermatophilaceae bacterium]